MTTTKIVLAIAVLITGACQSDSKPEEKPAKLGWRPVGTWSGRGNLQIESFEMNSGHWRIKWQTTNETTPGAGRFRVTVHSAVSGRPLMMAVEQKGAGHDIAYVDEDPRLFYLEIESSDEDWSIAVEEAVVTEGTIAP